MSNWTEIDKEIIKINNSLDHFFEDDFQLSSKIKHLDHLPDTKEYIKLLENKLMKIKGTNKISNKSKDIIQSLINVRQDTIINYLNDDQLNEISNDKEIENDKELINGNFIEKKIFPEKQALTAEELQELLKSDYLSKRTEELNESVN